MTDTAYALKRYGDPGVAKGAAAKFAAKWLVDYKFPDWLLPYWPKYGGRVVTHQWLNKEIIAPLEAVFKELIATGLVKELLEYGGAGNLRFKRNQAPIAANLSIHSWYGALDFNQLQNPIGVPQGSRKGMFTQKFLDVWRRHGWTCGADFSNFDGMHFQYLPGFDRAK